MSHPHGGYEPMTFGLRAPVSFQAMTFSRNSDTDNKLETFCATGCLRAEVLALPVFYQVMGPRH